MKIKELKSDLGVLKDFELSIGKIIEEEWEEEAGPTVFPSITQARGPITRHWVRFMPDIIFNGQPSLCTHFI
jgi:CO dehydrogenase/acetyl-CoA synthase alpha subunit